MRMGRDGLGRRLFVGAALAMVLTVAGASAASACSNASIEAPLGATAEAGGRLKITGQSVYDGVVSLHWESLEGPNITAGATKQVPVDVDGRFVAYALIPADAAADRSYQIFARHVDTDGSIAPTSTTVRVTAAAAPAPAPAPVEPGEPAPEPVATEPAPAAPVAEAQPVATEQQAATEQPAATQPAATQTAVAAPTRRTSPATAPPAAALPVEPEASVAPADPAPAIAAEAVAEPAPTEGAVAPTAAPGPESLDGTADGAPDRPGRSDPSGAGLALATLGLALLAGGGAFVVINRRRQPEKAERLSD